MNLNSKVMKSITDKFKIVDLSQWTIVSPADILSVRGAGDTVLNKIRLYLAHRGLSLRQDNPPSYWLDVLCPPVEPDDHVIHGVCPFTVIVDSNETYPFAFDSVFDKNGNRVKVPIEHQALWTMGLGDYTIKGMELDIQIERKADDIFPSLGIRREKFEEEIRRLSDTCHYAAVVCEYSWRGILDALSPQGMSLKTISRTVVSWQVKYPGVHWWFCEGRNHAEAVAYQLLEKFYWNQTKTHTKNLSAHSVSDLFAPIESL